MIPIFPKRFILLCSSVILSFLSVFVLTVFAFSDTDKERVNMKERPMPSSKAAAETAIFGLG
jgi:hypothetical protein